MKKALEYDSNIKDSDYLCNELGGYFADIDNEEKARKYFRMGIDKKDRICMNNLAVYLEKKKDKFQEEVVELYEKATKLDPEIQISEYNLLMYFRKI